MIIIGTHYFTWGSQKTAHSLHCAQCGTESQFIEKSGMRFITLFFVIPVIPISGISKMVQCPNCKTRYQNS